MSTPPEQVLDEVIDAMQAMARAGMLAFNERESKPKHYRQQLWLEE